MSYMLNPAYEVIEAEGGGIALNKKRGTYLQLNEMGYRVLRSLLEGRSTEQITTEIMASYPEQTHRIADDVRTLAEALRAKGVVTWTGS